MHIAVIAAQGRSGQAFVRAALAAGHTVRAGVGATSPFQPHTLLTTMPCDATNESEVYELTRDVDAVVSLLGHVKGSKADVQTDAMRVVIAAMKRHKITRIVSLTGTGVRRLGDTPSLIDRLANLFIATIDPNRIRDGIKHAEVLDSSGLDVTIIRVLKLGSGGVKPFGLTLHGPAKLLTSRREVAAAIVDVLENNRYIGDYPVISRR
jgi:hypothetical protein